MKVVLDTNVIISGLIWGGLPRKLMDLARSEIITLYTSFHLLLELENVLSRKKFANILASRNLNPEYFMQRYAMLACIVKPEATIQISRDPDDDAVIACATKANAEIIVTGDNDLLVLHPYKNILILNPSDALSHILLKTP